MHRRAHYGGGGFNTQPPEGGWPWISGECDIYDPFQHTAA